MMEVGTVGAEPNCKSIDAGALVPHKFSALTKAVPSVSPATKAIWYEVELPLQSAGSIQLYEVLATFSTDSTAVPPGQKFRICAVVTGVSGALRMSTLIAVATLLPQSPTAYTSIVPPETPEVAFNAVVVDEPSQPSGRTQ